MTDAEVARIIAWLKQRVGHAEAMWPAIGKLEEHIQAQAAELAEFRRLRDTAKNP